MSVLDETAAQSEAQITTPALSELKASVPWMKFLAILGFISAGFTLLTPLIALFQGEVVPALIGLILGGLYFYVSYSLFQYGNGITKFTFDKNPKTLELAFAKQKTFWMIIGILMIIMLALLVLMMIFSASIMNYFLQGGFMS